MTTDFKRAQLLRERGRHPEAIAAMLSYLAAEPDDAHGFIELALNRMSMPGELDRALADARTATGLMPENPIPLALQASILNKLDREHEALALADEALALDPEFGFTWRVKGFAFAGLKRWAEAEACALEALEIDPDDEAASNLLAHVLRMQNRLDESEEEGRRRLARDPENAFSFANAGWAALQRRQVKVAEGHFREALRLEPGLVHAREGLKESFRARSLFYRVFLRWAFFMQRLTGGRQRMITIGLLVIFKVLRVGAAGIHPGLVVAIALAYYLLVFGTWLATGVANFMLLWDRLARLALEPSEKADGLAVGVLFFGGITCLAVGLGFNLLPVACAGGSMMVAAIPISLVFTNPSKLGRRLFGAIGLAALGCGAAMAFQVAPFAVSNLLDRDAVAQAFGGDAGLSLGVMIFLIVATTWLGSVPRLRQAPPE